MITPIPIDQIAFSEVIPSVVKKVRIPKVRVPQVKIPTPIVPISAPKLNTDIKDSISTNQILTGIVVLAVVGGVIYLIHKNNQEKSEKRQIGGSI